MKFALIDANNMLYKVLHIPVYEDKKTERGDDIGGLMGFVNSLQAALKATEADAAICVWDGGHSGRRKAILPTYKEKDTDPEDKKVQDRFKHQRAVINKVLPMLCVQPILIAGKEGDDVIARMCSELTALNETIVIVSDDHDFEQLVSNKISVYRPSQKTEITLESLDGSPFHVVISKSCLGDQSDNIEGVPGVGPQTLKPLFANFYGDTIGEFIEHLMLSAPSSKRVQLLVENLNSIVLRNMHLVQLGLETFTEGQLSCIKMVIQKAHGKTEFNVEEVENLFTYLKIEGIIRDFDSWSLPFARLGVAV